MQRARGELVALEGAALPAIGSLLAAPRFVHLQHTADLIYPGAPAFYGHGGVLPFDVDWTHVRAGWLLESLVFESFGFARGTVHDGRKLQKFGGGDGGPADFPKAALAAAKDWLATHQAGWQRLDALREALESQSPERQGLAIGWLRAPDAPIRGFGLALYDGTFAPTVQRLASGGGELAEVAAHLLREAADPYWRGKIVALMAGE